MASFASSAVSLKLLATAMCQAHEDPADSERCGRPVGSLTRLGILASGEFDEEAAADLVGACSRCGAEKARGTICGSAVQSHLPATEASREDEMCRWSDPPFAVRLDDEFPAVGTELEAVLFNAADPGARARVVEPQLARGQVVLLHERIRENPTEGQAAARHDDAHVERRTSGRVQDALRSRLIRLVRSRYEPDEGDEAGEQGQRDNDQPNLPGWLHATHDRGRSWRWSSDGGCAGAVLKNEYFQTERGEVQSPYD